MSRNGFRGRARDTYGNVIQSADISVYVAGTSQGTAATTWTTITSGASATTTPQTTTNSYGKFEFFVDEDDYNRPLPQFDIKVDYGNYNMTYEYIDIFNSKTTNSEATVAFGNYKEIGEKSISVSGSYATVLTINIDDYKASFVKIFVTGNWASHGPVSYRAGFHVQNNAGGAGEPGDLSYENENKITNDFISGQIINTGDNFYIQLKTNDGGDGFTGGISSFTGIMRYNIEGEFNTVT